MFLPLTAAACVCVSAHSFRSLDHIANTFESQFINKFMQNKLGHTAARRTSILDIAHVRTYRCSKRLRKPVDLFV